MKAIYYITLATGLLCGGCIHFNKPALEKHELAPQIPQVESAFLTDQKQPVRFVKECADFWLGAKDTVNGGFYSFVDRAGKPTQSKKWLVGQSRLAFAFSRAFMLTGERQYLEHAEHALEFLYEHGWDSEHGGWNEMSEADGTPLSLHANRSSFVQHYSLLGPAAMCEATRSNHHCHWLEKGIEHSDKHLWDAHHSGYFNAAEFDFSRPQNKGFTPTVDALTTYALAAYLLWQKPRHLQRVQALADNINDYLVASIHSDETLFGFAEQFTSDWQIDKSDTSGSVGHMLKAAWVLLQSYQLTGDPQHLLAARTLLDHAIDDGGFDHTLGAPNSGYRWDARDIDSTKEYWQVEQGFTAGASGYYASDDPIRRRRYLEAADRSLQFFTSVLIDKEHGEIFSTADGETGAVINLEKGGRWKSGYHSTEMGYYAYLYGSLLISNRPATLHYAFDREAAERSYILSPIAIDDSRLHIEHVALNGQPYEHFDAKRRILHLPPHVGGVFAVTYRHSGPRPSR